MTDVIEAARALQSRRPPTHIDSRCSWLGDMSIADQPVTIVVESDDRTRTVKITGELDSKNRALVTSLCIDGRAQRVVVDLSELTFLDCGGYGAFVAASNVLERQCRTLTIVGAVGEPRLLLDLIRMGEKRRPVPGQ